MGVLVCVSILSVWLFNIQYELKPQCEPENLDRQLPLESPCMLPLFYLYRFINKCCGIWAGAVVCALVLSLFHTPASPCSVIVRSQLIWCTTMCHGEPISSGLPNEMMAINMLVVLATGLQQAHGESLVFSVIRTWDAQCLWTRREQRVLEMMLCLCFIWQKMRSEKRIQTWQKWACKRTETMGKIFFRWISISHMCKGKSRICQVFQKDYIHSQCKTIRIIFSSFYLHICQ